MRRCSPADTDSVAMFRRADMLASTHNTWAMEIDPDQTFVYELTRPDGRCKIMFERHKFYLYIRDKALRDRLGWAARCADRQCAAA